MMFTAGAKRVTAELRIDYYILEEREFEEERRNTPQSWAGRSQYYLFLTDLPAHSFGLILQPSHRALDRR
jgi:hypothetical protein